jgi:cell division septation protein DedD
VGPIASTPPSTQLADSSVASVAVGVIVLVAAAVVLLGGLALRRRPSS